MPSEAFRFKHVRNGAPIAPDELPKLPPEAAMKMLGKAKELGLNPVTMTEADAARVLGETMVDMVYLSLRRLLPEAERHSFRREHLFEDEDLDEVKACYLAIQERNPTLFPKVPAANAASDADPKGRPSALAPKPTAPSQA